jgi:hypothetical protein
MDLVRPVREVVEIVVTEMIFVGTRDGHPAAKIPIELVATYFMDSA